MAEKKEEPFSQVRGGGKRTHRNRRHKVLLIDDTWSSPPQYPVGTGAGLGSGINNQAGRLNCTPG